MKMRQPGSTFSPVPQVFATTAMFGRDQVDGNEQVPTPISPGDANAGNQPHSQNQIPLQSSHQRPPPLSSGYRVAFITTANGPFSAPEKVGDPPCHDLDGSPIFFGSAFIGNSVHPCKVAPHLMPVCRVPYGGGGEHNGRYDLLPFTQDMEIIPASGGVIPPGRRPVEGGYENGIKLYHAVGQIDGVRVPGKCGEHLGGANIPFGGEERFMRDYEILVWRITNRWEPIPEDEGREYFHQENPDWEQIYKEFAKVLPDRIVKANKAEKRLRSDLNQIETPEPKQTNQGNRISGNPGSAAPPAPPPVLPQGLPPAPPPAPPPSPQQNSQVYVKEISINKPPIFTGATNRAKK
ncbi:hypothetical protein PNOK_0773800 [Pyrrhoderma noxium]|uniref:Uncharacterized protein n=1 Tax=Pyrrhoderma noxium TaxID=2282107 RepID=A0A286U972_9AGAM|nr:hypothetical protein PNOK_0773800 [Pyrrhoderma noxium]